MGGLGSGRHWHVGKKDSTQDYYQIDIRLWQRGGLLEPGRRFASHWTRGGQQVASVQVTVEEDRVVLCYRHRSGGADWKDESYPVRLVWTPCHYGGRRAWFICPAQGCGRRVAILHGGSIFACRHCYQLAYPSQRENPDDRAARRADKIRARLGWEAGIINPDGEKPKGMHWRTFLRLKAEHDRQVAVSLEGMMARMGLLQERVQKYCDDHLDEPDDLFRDLG
jgi:hypothetical protein